MNNSNPLLNCAMIEVPKHLFKHLKESRTCLQAFLDSYNFPGTVETAILRETDFIDAYEVPTGSTLHVGLGASFEVTTIVFTQGNLN